jgi:hypothetical protein
MKYITNNTQTDTTTIKERFIKDIVSLLNKCNDISLLDLIKKLLEKSI